MKKIKKITSVVIAISMIMASLFGINVSAADETSSPSVSYCAHVQNIGWQDVKSDGKTAGTCGKALRVEALKINVSNLPYDGGIEYSAHVQNIGWQDYVSDGKMIGTSGRALRMEAIKIRLTGELANYYDVYYRTHVQNIGWFGWARNGEMSGSEGCSFRLEAIEIVLVKKGEMSPGSVMKISYSPTDGFKNGTSDDPVLIYSAHVQNKGWLEEVRTGETAGTTGEGLRLESFYLRFENPETDGFIEYEGYIEDEGWLPWTGSGCVCGTVGQGKRLEAFKIILTGNVVNQYDLYYRVHMQDVGWLNWAKNGEIAGIVGLSLRIEAIQITLVKKGNPAPAGTGKAAYVGNSESFKVLCIGNSFVGDFHRSTETFYNLGIFSSYLMYDDAYLHDYTDETHKYGKALKKILAERNFDYVVFYDQSENPITNTVDFYSSTAKLCEIIRENGATPVFFATWANRQDEYDSYNEYIASVRALDSVYFTAATNNDALIAQVGNAFNSYSNHNALYDTDGIHSSVLGSEIASEIIEATIVKDYLLK